MSSMFQFKEGTETSRRSIELMIPPRARRMPLTDVTHRRKTLTRRALQSVPQFWAAVKRVGMDLFMPCGTHALNGWLQLRAALVEWGVLEYVDTDTEEVYDANIDAEWDESEEDEEMSRQEQSAIRRAMTTWHMHQAVRACNEDAMLVEMALGYLRILYDCMKKTPRHHVLLVPPCPLWHEVKERPPSPPSGVSDIIGVGDTTGAPPTRSRTRKNSAAAAASSSSSSMTLAPPRQTLPDTIPTCTQYEFETETEDVAAMFRECVGNTWGLYQMQLINLNGVITGEILCNLIIDTYATLKTVQTRLEAFEFVHCMHGRDAAVMRKILVAAELMVRTSVSNTARVQLAHDVPNVMQVIFGYLRALYDDVAGCQHNTFTSVPSPMTVLWRLSEYPEYQKCIRTMIREGYCTDGLPDPRVMKRGVEEMAAWCKTSVAARRLDTTPEGRKYGTLALSHGDMIPVRNMLLACGLMCKVPNDVSHSKHRHVYVTLAHSGVVIKDVVELLERVHHDLVGIVQNEPSSRKAKQSMPPKKKEPKYNILTSSNAIHDMKSAHMYMTQDKPLTIRMEPREAYENIHQMYCEWANRCNYTKEYLAVTDWPLFNSFTWLVTMLINRMYTQVEEDGRSRIPRKLIKPVRGYLRIFYKKVKEALKEGRDTVCMPTLKNLCPQQQSYESDESLSDGNEEEVEPNSGKRSAFSRVEKSMSPPTKRPNLGRTTT